MTNSARFVPQDLIDRIIGRLKAEEPDLQAVLLNGSFARDEADAHSDFDVVAVTHGKPLLGDRTWFHSMPDGQLLHVSIGTEALQPPDRNEAATWSLGFPARDVQRYLWATPQARAVLGADPSRRLRAGEPQLEDFVECFMKVQRAGKTQDRRLIRWAARQLAEYAPGLLRPFNPERVVQTPIEAMAAALELPNTPAHFREDFEMCFGLESANDAEISDAATRLTRELLSFLTEQLGDEEYPSGDVRTYLKDGTILKYLFSA